MYIFIYYLFYILFILRININILYINTRIYINIFSNVSYFTMAISESFHMTILLYCQYVLSPLSSFFQFDHCSAFLYFLQVTDFKKNTFNWHHLSIESFSLYIANNTFYYFTGNSLLPLDFPVFVTACFIF